MKQAYTNTIRGGGARNPLTISTGSKKAGRGGANNAVGGGKKSTRQSKQQVPKCAYGAACRRKGCAYRHPSRSDDGTSPVYDSYHEDPRSKICKPFLAGLCTYGHKCLNRHPGLEEADAVRANYKEKSCSYGDDCQTEGCLYFHPWEAMDNAEAPEGSHFAEHNGTTLYTGDLCQAVERIHIGSTAQDVSTNIMSNNDYEPTYEQWVAAGCLPPPSLDETQLYNMWYHPESGMQRTPTEVYSLMFPSQQYSAISPIPGNLNARTPEFTPSWAGAQATDSNDSGQDVEPKSFQEWKWKGCPYPSWFYESDQNSDPWYDEEGVRRSLEEVYDVLYGENAAATRREYQSQDSSVLSSDPTPAELAAMIQAENPSLKTFNGQQHDSSLPTTGGWASIAAKPPEPVFNTNFQKQRESAGSDKARSSSFNESNGIIKKHKPVIIPKEVWLPDTANSDYFHMYPNPIERFLAVNNHHKSYLSSVAIPLCFDNDNVSSQNSSGHGSNSRVALLDVHFQSAKTITPVLDHFLSPSLDKHEEVWIVTGSGSHVAVGHQRREGGGVLFNAVRNYLEENGDRLSLEFRIGKNASGGKKSTGGAFLVRRIS